MNCWRGICDHRQDFSNGNPDYKFYVCDKDGQECDMVHNSVNGCHTDECRFGYVGCTMCYRYAFCDVT